jgi:hypothetical protein
MNNDDMSTEAKTVALLEEQLACMERVILLSLGEPVADHQRHDSHQEGVSQ